MDLNLKAVVRYDGAGFDGWQIQPGRRTIQGSIEEALSRIASAPIRVHGASRTDAGVHAFGQVLSFHWPRDLDLARLRRSLSQMLGPEIRVESVEIADPAFHARKSARTKQYAYALDLAGNPDPFSARYAWCIPWRLDPDYLASLGRRLEGEHDFAGFGCSGVPHKSTVRTLYRVAVEPGGVTGPMDARNLWRLAFHGNGFLYKMVRNITGTLVDVVRGRLPESRLDELLASPGPFMGHTAPAHGLTLIAVSYAASGSSDGSDVRPEKRNAP